MTTSFRDAELLSAYLDGQLNPVEAARLESRLAFDADLQAVLDDLRVARGLLRQLPSRRAPRNFTLTLKLAGIKPPIPRSYPALRLATMLATLLFIISMAVNGLAPLATSHLAAAPAPAYGVGGGGAGGGYGGAPQSAPQEAPAATQPPAQPYAQAVPAETQTPSALLSLAPAVTSTPAPPSEDNSHVQGTPTTEFMPKAFATQRSNLQPTETRSETPVPYIWVIGLGVLAIFFGIGAWILRLTSDRKFRKKFTNYPKG